jgi:outer membrane biosynthesis protein TonB
MQALDLPLDAIIAAKQQKKPSKVRAAATKNKPKVVKSAAKPQSAGKKQKATPQLKVNVTNVRPASSQSRQSTARSASSSGSILSRLGNGGGAVEGGTMVTLSNLNADILPSDVSELCATVGNV